jgi:hypothetical protein
MLSRREFVGVAGKGTAALLAVPSLLTMTGCSVVTDILNYIPVGLQAFNTVLGILESAGIISLAGGGAISAIVAAVSKGFSDLQVAIHQYDSAPAADKATFLLKVATVISDLQADIQTFWGDLSIPDPALATIISGLLGVILSTLAGFGASLPVPPLSAKAAQARALARQVVYTPKRRSVHQFRSDFNAQLGVRFVQFKLN